MAYAVCHLDGSPCRNLPRFHSGKQANKSCVTAMAFAKAVTRVPSVVFAPCAKDTVPCSQEVTGCHTWLTMKEYLLSLTSHLLPWLCCLSSEPMPAMAGESTCDAHCTHFILILHRVISCMQPYAPVLCYEIRNCSMLSTQDKAQLKNDYSALVLSATPCSVQYMCSAQCKFGMQLNHMATSCLIVSICFVGSAMT